MPEYSERLLAGTPFPPGALYDGTGVNFSLFSKNAEGVKLCLFSENEEDKDVHVIDVINRTGDYWHIFVPGLKPGQRYGYRVEGPFDPASGNRFNSKKLLIDPCARAIEKSIGFRDHMYAYDRIVYEKEGKFVPDGYDNAMEMNKSIVVDTYYDWEGVTGPRIPVADTIIYELHVKGFTKLHPDVPEGDRGTFRGLANKSVIDYLEDLGVTTVELLPVQHFAHNKFLLDRRLSNYWGYNTIGFFAPHGEYSASGSGGEQVREFKDMVKAYHKRGMEVIMDVVFNHTGEGDKFGPSISFRGIDNRSYYRLDPADPFNYMDYTGTGNTLDASRPDVLRLICDSLKYWAEEMHVDGFRFDLATTLTRGAEGEVMGSDFIRALQEDPVISKLKLIAEPWDLGKDGYQLGNFPDPFLEWNGKYRDTMRQYWRGDEKQAKNLASSFTGSRELYSDRKIHSLSGINFVTAHDGFTLHDLVSYNNKYNQQNGEGNNDGGDHNFSWNSGAEGPTGSILIHLMRERRKRAFLATLLLSRGVPMILHGDEYGRTQHGNNNAYCQDNVISWMKWEWNHSQKKLHEFTRYMMGLRKEINLFNDLMAGQNNTLKVLKDPNPIWLKPDGSEMNERDWKTPFNRCIGMHVAYDEAYPESAESNGHKARSMLVIFNSYWEPIPFQLPLNPSSAGWKLLVDTSNDDPVGNLSVENGHYTAAPRSLLLFIGE